MQRKGLFQRLTFALSLLSLVALPLLAAPQADEQPYEPVVFNFEGGRIDLTEAVRLTLEHDPSLLLAEEDVRTRSGVLQEQTGAFDWTFTGQLNYEHRIQELLEGRRQGEIDRRNQLRDVQVIACTEQDRLTIKEQELALAQQAETGIPISVDAGLAAQLGVIEALIVGADTPQEREALLDTRFDLINAELEQTRNALAETTQICTDAGEALDRLGEVPDEEEFDNASLALKLQKLTRSGISYAPFFNSSYSSTQFIGKRNGFEVPRVDVNGNPQVSPSGIPLTRLIDFGGKNIEDTYTFEVGFEVNVPLLRNRGRLATAASETAAKIDLEASELSLEHSASESTLNTAFAFWNLVSAQERVAVLQTSVELQRQVLDLTRTLIEADELPRAELSRSLAGEANSRAQLESASRDLVAAQLNLVRAMGLSVESEDNIPNADGTFPVPPNRDDLARVVELQLVQQGLSNRLDLQAARKVVESGGVLADAAFINLKPRLDLSLSLSSIARGESSLSNATDKWVLPSYKVGAAFEKPFGNNFALGRLAQARSRVRQGDINAGDLERLVRIGVVRTLGSLIEALDALEQAEAAAAAFEETVNAEFEKLRLGESTLIDALLTEQQRTSAMTSLIGARQQVANLVSQLRFETGSLVEVGEEGNRITWESLTTVPGMGMDQ